jgi:Fe-S oxidoreductase
MEIDSSGRRCCGFGGSRGFVFEEVVDLLGVLAVTQDGSSNTRRDVLRLVLALETF